jgi:hypothetical protein
VSNKTVMLIAIDSETPEGKALISEIDGRFMRAEWVDREHYAPMVLLEKAEALAKEHNARRIGTDRDCERLRRMVERYRAYVPSGIAESIEKFVDDLLRAKYGETTMSEITMEMARCDDVLEKMVPSDVRQLIGRAEKAEAKLKRIQQAAIHTAQGNCIIPSSMILEDES